MSFHPTTAVSAYKPAYGSPAIKDLDFTRPFLLKPGHAGTTVRDFEENTWPEIATAKLPESTLATSSVVLPCAFSGDNAIPDEKGYINLSLAPSACFNRYTDFDELDWSDVFYVLGTKDDKAFSIPTQLAVRHKVTVVDQQPGKSRNELYVSEDDPTPKVAPDLVKWLMEAEEDLSVTYQDSVGQWLSKLTPEDWRAHELESSMDTLAFSQEVKSALSATLMDDGHDGVGLLTEGPMRQRMRVPARRGLLVRFGPSVASEIGTSPPIFRLV